MRHLRLELPCCSPRVTGICLPFYRFVWASFRSQEQGPCQALKCLSTHLSCAIHDEGRWLLYSYYPNFKKKIPSFYPYHFPHQLINYLFLGVSIVGKGLKGSWTRTINITNTTAVGCNWHIHNNKKNTSSLSLNWSTYPTNPSFVRPWMPKEPK